ncbi:hypothetical protein ECANGB1_2385 [Enterospora canceri]|uniref:Uncharacterized protein n=1 Tax=Enterospora canceri TaxID=1081671 RepID=A0A1Y1S4R5_9MICR|nr:hypothetical protein ECANGB1_2385 [Enterospora canceri]
MQAMKKYEEFKAVEAGATECIFKMVNSSFLRPSTDILIDDIHRVIIMIKTQSGYIQRMITNANNTLMFLLPFMNYDELNTRFADNKSDLVNFMKKTRTFPVKHTDKYVKAIVDDNSNNLGAFFGVVRHNLHPQLPFAFALKSIFVGDGEYAYVAIFIEDNATRYLSQLMLVSKLGSTYRMFNVEPGKADMDIRPRRKVLINATTKFKDVTKTVKKTVGTSTETTTVVFVEHSLRKYSRSRVAFNVFCLIILIIFILVGIALGIVCAVLYRKHRMGKNVVLDEEKEIKGE